MNRIAPPLQMNTHSRMLHWLNAILINVKMMVYAGHAPLICPDKLLQWGQLRAELLRCHDYFHAPIVDEPRLLHGGAVEALDEFVQNLTAIWNKEPYRTVDGAWLEKIDALYSNIEQCKESSIKY